MGQASERERDTAIRGGGRRGTLPVGPRGPHGPGRADGSGVLSKADRSPVTVADFGSQALICRALAEAFPDDPLIAEEDSAELRRPETPGCSPRSSPCAGTPRPGPTSTQTRSAAGSTAAARRRYRDRFWTLDPIDGTKGFLRNEQYAVALALIAGGRVVVAALACPNLPLIRRR